MNNKSMNSKEIKSGLKTATLMNNKTMNNNYRTYTLDPPVQHNRSETYVETPRMRSSNNDYRTYTLDPPVQHNRSETYVETPRMRSSTCPIENKSGLKTATLYNEY